MTSQARKQAELGGRGHFRKGVKRHSTQVHTMYLLLSVILPELSKRCIAYSLDPFTQAPMPRVIAQRQPIGRFAIRHFEKLIER